MRFPHIPAAPIGLLLIAACRPGTEPETPLFLGKGAEHANGAATHRYEVTITNLTTGQPFSPGVIATHDAQATVWNPGDASSEGIRLIAENGDNGPAVTDLQGQSGIFDVVPVSAPIGCGGCPGPFPSSAVYHIAARADADRLSLAVMLICSNDGFTGVNGVKLPGGFQPAVFLGVGYDAGTEANDELSTSIVDPCFAIGPVAGAADGNLRTATAGVIAHHTGLTGGAGLTAAHAWTNPVVRIRIQRVE